MLGAKIYDEIARCFGNISTLINAVDNMICEITKIGEKWVAENLFKAVVLGLAGGVTVGAAAIKSAAVMKVVGPLAASGGLSLAITAIAGPAAPVVTPVVGVILPFLALSPPMLAAVGVGSGIVCAASALWRKAR